jgi:hypothetical protein
MSNKSEVAELLRQIETEYEAAHRGVSGYAAVARHAVISAHMERIEQHYTSLVRLVGTQEALALVAATSDKF